VKRGPTALIRAFPGFFAFGTPHANMGSSLPNRGVTTMKTLYCLSAALILTLSLMAATVVVPLSATQIIA